MALIATKLAYRKKWRQFQAWCQTKAFGANPAAAEIVASAQSVALVLKRAATAAGIPTPDISSHSLRAGFVTEAKQHGADDAALMDQTGHQSLALVQRYQRRAKKWEKPASEKRGL